MSIRLYIGNLPKSDVERQDLQAVFAEAGESVSAKVIKDRKTGKCRGFGFLTVEDDEQADAIIEKYNGAMFQELAIKLEKALPKAEEDEAANPVAVVAAAAVAAAVGKRVAVAAVVARLLGVFRQPIPALLKLVFSPILAGPISWQR
jgi:RNA recognition motif-containing protein